MKRKEFLKLLDKHLNGVATPDEEELLEEVYEDLRSRDVDWTSSEMDELQKTEDDMLARIRMEGNTGEPERSFPWFKIAAAILLIGSISLVTYKNFLKPQEPVMISRVAPPGKVIRVVLPDSSQVWLNGGSSILYPESFPDSLREVKLNGEAFFDVVHHTKQPFIVQTSNLKTQVLGTSFNVKAYKDDLKPEVTVVSGKVAVYHSRDAGPAKQGVRMGKSIFLLPGESIAFNTATNELTKIHSNTTEVIAWKTGRLIYKNTPLWRVAADLQHVHQIRVVLNAAIKDCPVYGTFENKTPEQIIKLIAYSINGEFGRLADGYQLKGKGCM